MADHITENAERENLGVNFLEDRVQRMLNVFYMRLSSANVAEGVTTDMSLEGQWWGRGRILGRGIHSPRCAIWSTG